MKTDEIAIALQKLSSMAGQWVGSGCSAAIERDLILARLRDVYEAVLTAEATADRTNEAGAGVRTVAEVYGATAAGEPIEFTLDAAEESVAEEQPSAGDVDSDQPAAAVQPTAASYEAEEQAPADAVDGDTPPAEKQSDTPADVPSAAPADAPAQQPADGSRQSDLLFDLGSVQQRKHRRMMSLYDDDAFDRLPDVPSVRDDAAAAETAETAADRQKTETAATVVVEAAVEYAAYGPQPAAESGNTAEADEEYVKADRLYMIDDESIDLGQKDNADEPAGDTEESYPGPDDTDGGEDDGYADSDEWQEQPDGEPEDEFAEDDEPEDEPEYDPVDEADDETDDGPYGPDASDAAGEPRKVSVHEQASAHTVEVLGDVMNSDVEVLGDKISAPASLGDMIARTPVRGLKSAMDISDYAIVVAQLFGGSTEACDAALTQLDEAESLEDAVIYIEEHFDWNPSSEAAGVMMNLLERKFF